MGARLSAPMPRRSAFAHVAAIRDRASATPPPRCRCARGRDQRCADERRRASPALAASTPQGAIRASPRPTTRGAVGWHCVCGIGARRRPPDITADDKIRPSSRVGQLPACSRACARAAQHVIQHAGHGGEDDKGRDHGNAPVRMHPALCGTGSSAGHREGRSLSRDTSRTNTATSFCWPAHARSACATIPMHRS